MDLNNLLFSTVSELTNGLINDLSTVIIGLITLGFIVMGVDLIKNLFENFMQDVSYRKGLTRAEKYKDFMGTLDRDSVEYDVMRRKYSKHIGSLADKYHFRE